MAVTVEAACLELLVVLLHLWANKKAKCVLSPLFRFLNRLSLLIQ